MAKTRKDVLPRKAATFRRPQRRKTVLCQNTHAAEAIGTIEKGESVFMMTFGQIALMDAMLVILDQSGPASVDISTWNISDANIEQTAELIEEGKITRLRMLLDRSFPARKPVFDNMVRQAFGVDAIRFIETHAKLLIVRSAKIDVVVQASMNMNQNPRLENMEICEDPDFAEFLTKIFDSVFQEVAPEELRRSKLLFDDVPQLEAFTQVEAYRISRSTLNEPKTTHTLRKL